MIAAIRNSLYLAWRYLAFHKGRSLVLIGALSIIVFVPLLLELVVRESRKQLSVRADTTPLLLGAPGSALDLVMNSLYFTRERPALLRMSDAEAIDATGLARAIPLNVRFRAGAYPIVGTTLDYFRFRGLSVAEGRPLAVLGDAVIGSRAATRLGLSAGDSVISTPEDLFNLAGQYPLKLNIVGILAPALSPDDDALFVDLRTSWIIEGLGHGHEDLIAAGDPAVILERDATTVTANAALRTYTSITPDNLSEFHFHGDRADFSITSAIAVPDNARASAILLGRYQGSDNPDQLVRPGIIIDELIETIFRIKRVLDIVVLTVALATLLTVALVFLLSLRLRERELATIFRLGCSRMAIGGFVAAEIFLIVTASTLLSGIFLALSVAYRADVVSLLLA